MVSFLVDYNYPWTKRKRNRCVLYLAMVGGLPIASAIVDRSQDDPWFLDLVCSATHTRAGSMLLRAIQHDAEGTEGTDGAKGIRLIAVSQNVVPFYEDHGFAVVRSGGRDVSYQMAWRPTP